MKLTKNYDQNFSMLSHYFNIQQNYDITERQFLINTTKACFYFIDGFLKDDIMERIFEFLMQLDVHEMSIETFEKQAIPYVEVSLVSKITDLSTQLLSGASFCVIDGFDQAIVLDARTYPNRSISEPEDDRVLRGSRDAFVETLVFNTALIRRRIRDPHLTMQLFQIGSKSQTDIVCCYLSNCVDVKQFNDLKQQLTSIDIPSLSLAQESLAECLIRKSWWNPFPRIRYTERPDTAVANIMEGKIIVIIDNSPAVMVLPTSFFDFTQETNDFYFPPLIGTYLRWVRCLIFFFTLFLTPFWLFYLQNHEIFPSALSFLKIQEMNDIPIIVQLFIVEFMIDAIKLASLNTPSSLSGSFGVIGALVLGEFAVKARWFVPEVLLYMAFVALANFTQPSYELGYSLKLSRMVFYLLIFFLNGIGFLIGIIGLFLLLLTTPTILHQNYLFPLIPFNFKKIKELFIRVPIDSQNS